MDDRTSDGRITNPGITDAGFGMGTLKDASHSDAVSRDAVPIETTVASFAADAGNIVLGGERN
jgi:hypothetical protein